MKNMSFMFCIWCFIKTYLKKFVFDVSNNKQIESWFDMTFKTSLNTLYEIFCKNILRRSMNPIKNKFLNCHQRKAILHRTFFDTKEVITCYNARFEGWTLHKENDMHLMQTLSAPNHDIHNTKIKWRNLPVVRQHAHLKMRPI